MIIDTHCHLHFPDFDADREEVIRRAQEAGVKYLVNVGTDPETNEKAKALTARHAACMVSTAGLHPHYAHQVGDSDWARFETFVKNAKVAAIGEVGLDYFKSEAPAAVQKKIFANAIRVARENDLPLIVHSRNAFEDTFEILKSEGAGKIRGVMHCFSYDGAALEKLLDLGFLASFTCNLTYKNAAALLTVAAAAPLDRVMLETDSPYLAPQALRGTRNEPANLVHLAQALALRRGVSREEIERVTSQNAIRFFRLDQKK